MARLRELAELAHGRLVGDGQTQITGAAPLGDVQPGQITFIDQPEKATQLGQSGAGAAIVPIGTQAGTLPLIEVEDVHAAFVAVLSHFRPPRPGTRIGISPQAFVSPTARLAKDVNVHPGAYIGDEVEIGGGSTIHSGVQIMAGCTLGADVTIYPNAVLYEDTRVGDRVVIHAAAVVGADGFGYRLVNGRHRPMAQLGHVEIGPDVEIGAGSTIDRGTYGPTRIGEGTKIDDQVMIAHNCRIGKHNLICSQVGIAGSSSTGDYVVLAGQAGVRDHVHIGSRAVIGAMSGIISDVPEDACWLGVPATPEKEQWLKHPALAKLPEMRRELKRLERTVEELQKRLGEDRSAAA
jgi:UDP-3-O-[3-hydroxymyristoyl] glucosamine N-acyltransferase